MGHEIMMRVEGGVNGEGEGEEEEKWEATLEELFRPARAGRRSLDLGPALRFLQDDDGERWEEEGEGGEEQEQEEIEMEFDDDDENYMQVDNDGA
jgi:hypothetical protein